MKLSYITAALLTPITVIQASPVIGQQAVESEQSGDGQDIVVIGEREKTRGIFYDTRTISGAHDGQLPRFQTIVCPLVIGLQQPQGRFVEQRISNVAARAHIRTGPPGCAPNLTIVIAEDGPGFIKTLLRRRPNLFNSLTRREEELLIKSSGPAWTWQSIIPKTRDGGPVEMISQLEIGNGPPRPVPKGSYVVKEVQPSRILMPVRQDIDSSFIVLDANRIKGFSLQQISDYSAMVGLASIRAGSTKSLSTPSILTLFDDRDLGREPQSEATSFDNAYLAGLYTGESSISSDQKSRFIASTIIRGSKP